ncbi:635_t:CDS:2 [Rhizophagus irregularis]|nr:635_t:CDS:2 [Rhizophagus irregularis]
MSSKKSTPTQAFLYENKKSLNPITEEQQYVHDVYEKIAQHFSSTRYKPWPVDFVTSIAVIHHFTTPERRITAIKELFRIAKPGSKVLIYVWAMEQTESRRKFDENYQDVFVPWVIPADKNEKREEIQK